MNTKLYVVFDLKGGTGNARPYVARQGDDRQPGWARSQSHIYFVRERGSRPGVYRIPVDDAGNSLGEPEFCYEHLYGLWSFHSWKSVFFSDTRALVTVRESESDIWLMDLQRD